MTLGLLRALPGAFCIRPEASAKGCGASSAIALKAQD